LRNLPTIRKLQ